MTEAVARSLDRAGSPYTVIIGKRESPFAFIERSSEFYGVNFLDERTRVYLTYSFEEVQPGRLFLKEAIFHEFADDQDEPSKSTAYWFHTDGQVVIETVEYPGRKASRVEKRVDVERNWSKKPEFGRYEELIKAERTRG